MTNHIYKDTLFFILVLFVFSVCKNPSAEKKELAIEIPKHVLLKEQPKDISASDGISWDSGFDHSGFRTVATVEMLKE